MSSGAKRELVAPQDALLGEILDRLGPDARAALADGRLFIGRKRAQSENDQVRAGELLTMHAPRAQASGAYVIAERDEVIAAFKPAAMPTIPDHRGAKGSLLDAIQRETGLRLHATSRLDVGVSGVVLLTASEAAASRLAKAREQGLYRRRYVAIATRAPEPERGLWAFPIGRAPNPRHRRIGGPSATEAETLYRTVARASSGPALLALEPQTGRTHQLRLHSSHAGCPLLGDTVYGGPSRIVSRTGAVKRLSRIALHAAWVEVPDAGGKPVRFDAEAPDELLAIWEAAGGAREAFEAAVERW